MNILNAMAAFLRGDEVQWLYCPKCWGRFRKGDYTICPQCQEELVENTE